MRLAGTILTFVAGRAPTESWSRQRGRHKNGTVPVWALTGLWVGLVLAALAAAPCRADDGTSGSPIIQPMPPSAAPSNYWSMPIVPNPPVRPGQGSRPASWPGGPPVDTSWGSRSNQPVPGVALQPCDGAQIVARVGSEAILKSDMMDEIRDMVQKLVAKNKDSLRPQEVDAFRSHTMQLAAQSPAALRQALRTCVQRKLICQDAKNAIPAESWTKVEDELRKDIENTQVDVLMKRANVSSRAELEKKLRAEGSSLEREKRFIMEQILASEWIRQQVKRDDATPSELEMLSYYRSHRDEFTSPARAQYEELMVRYPDGKYPTEEAARAAIAQLGNRVLSGVPFAQVAREGSDGATAPDGGQRPWTHKGALACQAVDQALFNLPLGQLSPILESPRGFYIIRVTRREDAQVKAYRDAQVDIKDKIAKQRSDKQLKDYLDKLEAKTPTWTIFDSAEVARRPGATTY